MNLRPIAFGLLLALVPASATMAQKKKKQRQPDNVPAQIVADTLAADTAAAAAADTTAARQPADGQHRDSLDAMQRRIAQLERMLSQQRRQLEFADTCIVRQGNNALNAPYDERRLHSALAAFDRISSQEYRTQMLPLRHLLADYGSHYGQLMDILRRADADRDLRNPFGGEQTAQRYIDEIRQTAYCREVMQQEWVIPYLSSLVRKAIDRLKANKPGENHTANLKDLLTP